MLDVRPSPIAGTWYEGNPETLARTVDEYLDEAELPELNGEVLGVIAPHAGHLYSGAVAGYAFATLRSLTPELVAIIAPMHHPYPYSTPLGRVPADKEALLELDVNLKSELGFGLSPVSRDKEHSLEIELPFLQRALKPGWKLLPVMVRAHTGTARLAGAWQGSRECAARQKIRHGRQYRLVAFLYSQNRIEL
jgi:AmmeMemoRadiSam system protein B